MGASGRRRKMTDSGGGSSGEGWAEALVDWGTRRPEGRSVAQVCGWSARVHGSWPDMDGVV